MLQIVFMHGVILHVEFDLTKVLNDFEMVTKVSNIGETLVKLASYHRIKRGKVLGIRSPIWNQGKLVELDDIALLPFDVAPHLAWELVQEHQNETTSQLLKTVSLLQAEVIAACPLSDNQLKKLEVLLCMVQ